jgi:hypothetical protein
VIGIAAIDTGALVKVIWTSLLAGTVITSAFVVGLYGVTRYGECRREDRGSTAIPFAVLGAAGFLIFVAAVVEGFVVMVSK